MIKKILNVILVLVILLVGLLLYLQISGNTLSDTQTVENLKLEEYLGTWNELYRSDNIPFQKDCVCGVRAIYEKDDNNADDVFSVLNICVDKLEKNNKNEIEHISYEEAIGQAKITNISGKFLVSFRLINSVPFSPISAEYNVLYFDNDYAIVNGGDYYWILSREDVSEVDEFERDFILNIAENDYSVPIDNMKDTLSCE